MMRADAVQNRRRVLAEARRALADGDDSLKLNELARRAGVGVGTVYRQFPTRAALLEAITEDGLRELIEVARALQRENDGPAALARFIRSMVTLMLTQPGMVDVVLSPRDESPETTKAKIQIAEAVSVLLAQARAGGAPQIELDGTDVLKLLCGLHHAISTSSDSRTAADRFVRVILLGLGLPTDQPPPLEATPAPG